MDGSRRSRVGREESGARREGGETLVVLEEEVVVAGRDVV
jgi:hypothetical protein